MAEHEKAAGLGSDGGTGEGTTNNPQASSQSSTYGPHLLPQHANLLSESAISPAVAEARGYRSIETKADLQRKGFSAGQRNVPGLLIPIFNAVGEFATYQYRPDDPRIGNNGKPTKYETPNKSRMVLDVPRAARDWLGDPKRPLFITEGARKADAGVSAGLCCVALLGVWNFRGTNGEGGKTALPDWEYIALNERDVYIVYDSDVVSKLEVHQALVRLKALLEQRGARVHMIYLPPLDGGRKQGLDDYLAAGHDISDLLTLATSEVRTPPGADVQDPKPSSRYTARFEGLIDIVEGEDGKLCFLLLQDGQLQCAIEHAGQFPPLRDQLPFLLPRAVAVLAYYGAGPDLQLFDDLVAYHDHASQLPSKRYAVLLAAFSAHTYLMECWQYTPILVLYAVPERGKTRTGKAIATYRTVVCTPRR